ncbi:MAG: hypothetical protein ACK44M_05990 [Chloroflexus sp.]
MADLWFTLRSRPVETIAEEVSDWLTERQIPFDRFGTVHQTIRPNLAN